MESIVQGWTQNRERGGLVVRRGEGYMESGGLVVRKESLVRGWARNRERGGLVVRRGGFRERGG